MAISGRRLRLVHVKCPFCGQVHVHEGGYEGDPVENIYRGKRTAPCNNQVYEIKVEDGRTLQWMKMYVFVVEGHRKTFPEDQRPTNEIWLDILENWAENGLIEKDEADGSYNLPRLIEDTFN